MRGYGKPVAMKYNRYLGYYLGLRKYADMKNNNNENTVKKWNIGDMSNTLNTV